MTTCSRCPNPASVSAAGRGCGGSSESYAALSPSDPTRGIKVSRVLVRDGLWVVEGIADYDDGRAALNVVLILELRDGKLWRDRWYFAEPFEAPEWRSQWVEHP